MVPLRLKLAVGDQPAELSITVHALYRERLLARMRLKSKGLGCFLG